MIVLAALVLYFISSQPVFAAASKKVLILNSYHQGYKWTDEETQGIVSAINPRGNNVEIFIEYMGTKMAADDFYFSNLGKVLKHKFRNVRLDVIVAADNDAFAFLKKYRADVFGMVPVVFCGVNWVTEETVAGVKLYTGVNEDADIPATLDLMIKLHPRTKGIYVIADTTTTGNIVRRKIQELVPTYRDRIAFYLLPDMDMKDILNTLSHAQDDTLVLLTIFQQDKAGDFYEFSESTRMISESSRVPVYGLWDFNLGFGIAGGMLTSGRAQGQSAGLLTLRILNGEAPDSIPVIMKSPNKYMFDFTQLERFDISVSDIPEGSEVINRPESFFKVHKWFVWGTFAGIIIMTLIVIFLLKIIAQRKKAEAELQESRDKLEQRVKDRTTDLAEMNQSLIAEITERRKVQKRLRELSEMDPLTGIYNRRRLHELLKAELSKAKRHERNLSLIMIDLDHFKNINDKFGHDVGDLVLKRAAEIMQGTIRQGDICARFGGEEFVIVAPETPLIGAVSLAEKIRVSFDEEIFMQVGRVTISAGATSFKPGDSEASLIKRADEALYAAKNAGRNMVKAAL